MKIGLILAKIKAMLPYLLTVTLAFYLLPALILLFRDHHEWGMPLFMTLLLVIDPLICLVCSLAYGAKHSFNILFAVFVTVLFWPGVYIYFSASALFYAAVYGVVALAGNAAGWLFYRRRGSRVKIIKNADGLTAVYYVRKDGRR